VLDGNLYQIVTPVVPGALNSRAAFGFGLSGVRDGTIKLGVHVFLPLR
jgi:hypothetical protein